MYVEQCSEVPTFLFIIKKAYRVGLIAASCSTTEGVLSIVIGVECFSEYMDRHPSYSFYTVRHSFESLSI